MKRPEPDRLPVFAPADLVAALNQTFEAAYGRIMVVGELSGFRVSKNRWVYFDLKDELAAVACFGSVYQLPGPLEDGLTVQIIATPRIHRQFGFSLNFSTIQPIGEGSLHRAGELLRRKLDTEGLFAAGRKRPLPFAPEHIGLVTAAGSAAYADFIKIINKRWGGISISVADSLVQGVDAPDELANALSRLNQLARQPEVVVITRGGGSAEDLAAFNDERLVRAIAASRMPTLVAIGHETDTCLAELAADARASTPSDAAQLLLPDKQYVLAALNRQMQSLTGRLGERLSQERAGLVQTRRTLYRLASDRLAAARHRLLSHRQLLAALSPRSALLRGYALVRYDHQIVRFVRQVAVGQPLNVELSDGTINAKVEAVNAQIQPKKS